MDTTLITYLLPLHSLGWLNALVECITVIAESEMVLLVGAILYWCVDKKMGQKMGAVAVSGVFWTLGLKNVFKVPRPHKWMDAVSEKDVLRIETATGYSFPSGHTTSAVMIYGYLAKAAKWAVRILLWVLVALVGFSRIYMANHTAYDVLAALVIGFGWVYLGSFIYDTLMQKSEKNIFWFYLPMVFAIGALFSGIDPVEAVDTIKMCGLGTTLILGIYLERKFVNYTVRGTLWERIVKFLVGIAVVLLFNLAPKLFFSEEAQPVAYLAAKTVAYAAIGLWMAYLYPLLLKRFDERREKN